MTCIAAVLCRNKQCAHQNNIQTIQRQKTRHLKQTLNAVSLRPAPDHMNQENISEHLGDRHKANHDYTIHLCGASSEEIGEAQEARRGHS